METNSISEPHRKILLTYAKMTWMRSRLHERQYDYISFVGYVILIGNLTFSSLSLSFINNGIFEEDSTNLFSLLTIILAFFALMNANKYKASLLHKEFSEKHQILHMEIRILISQGYWNPHTSVMKLKKKYDELIENRPHVGSISKTIVNKFDVKKRANLIWWE